MIIQILNGFLFKHKLIMEKKSLAFVLGVVVVLTGPMAL